MVKITKGVDVFEVTRGAFDGIYSRQGYSICDEEKECVDEHETSPEMGEDEKFLSEIVEKPVSQWSKEEVKRFATLNDISLTGTKFAEAKDIIKKFIEENE